MQWLVVLVIVVVLMVIGKARNADTGYTIGRNMFKNSDNNLEKDNKLDFSDHDYYNDRDKLK